ncbi:MAG: two-component sensor histidine kinase [Crocinitomicaceae bacterium]|jgi:two-component sensor histidine kinase
MTLSAFGQDYFLAIAQSISESIGADYIFVTKVDLDNGRAHPIVTLKHGIPIENVSYDLMHTPCLHVIDSCIGYYPVNVQDLFPKDEFFKLLNITGYIGASLVPKGRTTPIAIITCLYEIELKNPKEHFDIIQNTAQCIEHKVERELLLKENYLLHKKERETDKAMNQVQLMLKEIHHRIKNNLQIVSSLINLQKTKTDDEGVKILFDECQQKIQAIALVHDMLYASNDLKTIKVNTYIKALIKNQVDLQQYDLTFNIENVSMSIDKLIPCGLIIIECCLNTIKHAYPEGGNQSISLQLTKDDGIILLKFQDSGIGFPTDRGINLSLIAALTEQIDGNIITRNEGGAVIEIKFKD